MKYIRHEKSIKPETMELGTNPMCIWLDRHTELRIEKGDDLKTIVKMVNKAWKLGADAKKLVAFWFAIGERVHSKKLGAPWGNAELRTSETRRYLMR
jgi:hypothetical protein